MNKEMMKIGIYVILNLMNGMIYVGGSKNLNKRQKEHFNQLMFGKHNNIHLQRTYDKYGPEIFQFIVVEIVKEQAQLREIEQLWINASDCCNRKVGYNLNPTAGSQLGFKFSEDSKRKMSLTRKGRKFTLEHKTNMSASMKGIKRSEETKRKISIAKKNITIETRAKMSAWQKGRKLPEETRVKLSIAQKQRWARNRNGSEK